MHIFLWFGWSLGWSIFFFFPLLRRLVGVIRTGGGKPARRQGSIRLLLGTLGVICASSGLAALFGDSAGDDRQNTFGHTFSAALSGRFNPGIAALIMLGLGLACLPWMLRLGRRNRTGDVEGADSGVGADTAMTTSALYAATLPGREKSRDSARADNRYDPPPAMPAASNTVGARISERKMQRDSDRAARRTGPWQLPATHGGAGAAGSVSTQSGTDAKAAIATRAPWSPATRQPQPAPARNETQWAPFESLRPTAAMIARARKTAAAEKHAAAQATAAGTIGAPSRVAAPAMAALAGTGLLASRTGGGTSVRTTANGSPTASAGIATQFASPTAFAAAGVPAQTATAPIARQPSIASAAAPTPTAPVAAMTPAKPAMPPLPVSAPSTAAPAFATASEAAAATGRATTPSAWPWRTDAQAGPAVATTPSTSVSPHAPATGLSTASPAYASAAADATSTPPARGFYTHAPVAQVASAATIAAPRDYDEPDMILPALDLLDAGGDEAIEIPAAQLEETGRLIEQRLKEFKVPVTVLGAYSGPVITRYEVEPALGVRGAQIVNLMKDLSRALGLTSIRVVETIPGKTCMGLELPNGKRQMIRLAEIFESDAYRLSDSGLTLAMGKDITGLPVVTDLARAPHMLVAGTTGSGKSVAINAMILSLLYKSTPHDVRLIMIDPKMLELSVYDGIPHLLAPVVTDMKLAGNALTWCVTEMDKRYRLMSALGVRNLAGYNQKIRDGIAAEKRVKNPFSLTPDAPEPLDTLPLIVVIIDELADLMMVTGKKIEELIARLAQKARAAGIHLILATQRPSVDVITGLIKANIPTRVAFQVSSKIDSRTVLDQMGAEALLGHGDMLFLPPGSGYPQRVHGAFVSDQEVHRVVQYLKSCGEPDYEEAILSGPPSEAADSDLPGDTSDPEADPLYDEAVAFVARTRRASISSVQRQFRVGYNRAARLVEQMEAAGILSSMATNGSRDVLVPPLAE